MEVLMKEFKDSHFAVIKATELCYEFKKQLHIGDVIGSRTWNSMVSRILDDLDTPKELRPSKDYIGNESVSGPEIVADQLMTLGLIEKDTIKRPTQLALEKCMPTEEKFDDPRGSDKTIEFLNDISKEPRLRENTNGPEFAMLQVRLGRAALLPQGIFALTTYGNNYRNYLNSK
jgi:hypothetical protein